MPGFDYMIAAYLIFLVGLFLYLFFLTLRSRELRTEMVALREQLNEQQQREEER